MLTYHPDVILIISIGTLLLLLLAGFITSLLVLYKQRYKAHQQQLISLQEIYQRELLQSQLEIQNQTLQQVGNDLHDNIGQLLTVTIMRLTALEDEVTEPDAQQSVQQTRELVRTIITDVRALSKTLDFDTVRRFGLLPSLTLELERIRRAGRIRAELTTLGEPYSLGEQPEIVLLRMAQEALNNALKHAQAKVLTVTTDYKDDFFTLTIADDGRGFSVHEAQTRTLDQAGAGLGNLYRRTNLLGGTCLIDSIPNEGTRIVIKLPRKPKDDLVK
jgi:signal transduction histidine kinase